MLATESHGGNLAEARRLFPQASEPWLDLSAAVNPHAYPFTDLSPDVFARLPEEDDLRRLGAAAAAFYGVADVSCVVAAPGTQALIQWLPRIAAARRVGIQGFTYSEHARSWRNAGADVRTCARLEDLTEMDVAVVVNPNNPDGRLVAAADLADLAAHLAKRGSFLVADEAYVDFLPQDASLASAMPAGAIVLRSFGKCFGLPGLRLGFAIASPEFCVKLRAALGLWPVSGAAIAIGCKAFADSAWLPETRGRLTADAAKLDACLAAAGFTPIGGTPLFRLVQHPDAAAIFDRLGRAGIWVRRFAEKSDWLRFSIPRDEAALRRLRLQL